MYIIDIQRAYCILKRHVELKSIKQDLKFLLRLVKPVTK